MVLDNVRRPADVGVEIVLVASKPVRVAGGTDSKIVNPLGNHVPCDVVWVVVASGRVARAVRVPAAHLSVVEGVVGLSRSATPIGIVARIPASRERAAPCQRSSVRVGFRVHDKDWPHGASVAIGVHHDIQVLGVCDRQLHVDVAFFGGRRNIVLATHVVESRGCGVIVGVIITRLQAGHPCDGFALGADFANGLVTAGSTDELCALALCTQDDVGVYHGVCHVGTRSLWVAILCQVLQRPVRPPPRRRCLKRVCQHDLCAGGRRVHNLHKRRRRRFRCRWRCRWATVLSRFFHAPVGLVHAGRPRAVIVQPVPIVALVGIQVVPSAPQAHPRWLTAPNTGELRTWQRNQWEWWRVRAWRGRRRRRRWRRRKLEGRIGRRGWRDARRRRRGRRWRWVGCHTVAARICPGVERSF